MPRELTESEKQIEVGLDAKKGAENCNVEIRNALKRWNCRIDAVVEIIGTQFRSTYAVVPLILVPMGKG